MQVHFSDFIGVFDDVLPKDLCERTIASFKDAQELGAVVNRQQESPSTPALVKDDEAFSLNLVFPEIATEIDRVLWLVAYPEYAKKYPILKSIGGHYTFEIKVQKTVPGGGYHVWHCEQGAYVVSDRIMAFTFYLNDVEEGGETEFLYQHRRVNAKQGRLALWPASYTHTHRGNPPLTGEKYIATGWITYRPPDALQDL